MRGSVSSHYLYEAPEKAKCFLLGHRCLVAKSRDRQTFSKAIAGLGYRLKFSKNYCYVLQFIIGDWSNRSV